MRIYLIATLMIFNCDILRAQGPIEKIEKLNSIQLEMSGTGRYFTTIFLGYERIFHQTDKFAFLGKIGGGFWQNRRQIQKSAMFEAGIMNQANRHHFEMGIYAKIENINTEKGKNTPVAYYKTGYVSGLRFGYRYQKPHSSWLVRTSAFMPIIYGSTTGQLSLSRSYRIQNILSPWPVISVGKSF
jgi:hypothetical protein